MCYSLEWLLQKKIRYWYISISKPSIVHCRPGNRLGTWHLYSTNRRSLLMKGLIHLSSSSRLRVVTTNNLCLETWHSGSPTTISTELSQSNVKKMNRVLRGIKCGHSVVVPAQFPSSQLRLHGRVGHLIAHFSIIWPDERIEIRNTIIMCEKASKASLLFIKTRPILCCGHVIL